MKRQSTVRVVPEAAMVPHIPSIPPQSQMPEAQGLTVLAVEITPDLASTWLKYNTRNRTPSRSARARYAHAMALGHWHGLNGATIVWSDDGVLLDGQTRLQACVESGKAFTSLVVWGVSRSAQGSMDVGTRRTLGDFLSLEGLPNGRNLAAVAGLVAAYERDELGRAMWGRTSYRWSSFAEGVAFVENRPGLIDATRHGQALHFLLVQSWAGMLYYVFHGCDPGLAEVWYEIIRHGASLTPVPTFVALRERFIRLRQHRAMDRLVGYEQAIFAIKAWNAVRSGKVLNVFRLGEGEPFPGAVKPYAGGFRCKHVYWCWMAPH